MHGIVFIQDLAVVMIVAGLVTVLFHRFRQPVVLGYILAGFIVGPYTPPFPLVQDEDTIRTLADLGVTFLVFSLGLQFSVRTLRQVGTTAVIASSLEVAFMLFLGYSLGQWFGWSVMDSIFLGAMLSITSTTIIIKTLDELNLLKAPFASRIFGIQIIEDTLGMTLIVLLTGLAATGVLAFTDAGLALGRVAIFVAAVLVIGFLIVPRLIHYVAGFRSDEMLLITVLALCFGVTFAAVILNHSIVLGAFLIGTIIGETREIVKIKTLTAPVRDMFSAIFFVTIGMLIQPALLIEYAWPILIISVAAVVGKVFIFSTGTFIAGNDGKTSLRVGSAMMPIGELSFVIASVGLVLGVTSDFLYPIAVSVSAITMPLTPYLVRNSDRIIAGLEAVTPAKLRKTLTLYHYWTGKLSRRRTSLGMKLARKWLLQLTLNFLLIAAIFLSAAYMVYHMPAWLPRADFEEATLRALYWLVAAVLALPLYVATLRKIQAIGMLIAEVSLTGMPAGPRKTSAQNMLANIILAVGFVLVGIVTVLLSSAFLPPWHLMILLLIIVALITWLSWRHLIRIYSRAQGALQDALSPETPMREQEPSHSQLARMLKQASLQRIRIAADAPASGKLLSELQLRTRSGASVVAIERGDDSLINPEPGEEIQSGDILLLIGTREQIEGARTLLCDQDEQKKG